MPRLHLEDNVFEGNDFDRPNQSILRRRRHRNMQCIKDRWQVCILDLAQQCTVVNPHCARDDCRDGVPTAHQILGVIDDEIVYVDRQQSTCMTVYKKPGK